MDRRDLPVVTFFWSEELSVGRDVDLNGDQAQHARVRRVERGDPVRLLDGAGHIAEGRVTMLGKNHLTVSVEHSTSVPALLPLGVIVPVADRDRMLLAAEKSAELQVTSWEPVYFARSRSVSPRGEGARFRDKVRARMQSALEQSGGAWIPRILEEAEAIDALRSHSSERRILLDISGEPLPSLVGSVPTVLAAGPEGGLEPRELSVASENGWTPASLGTTTLRFETAILAAAAIVRASQLTKRSS